MKKEDREARDALYNSICDLYERLVAESIDRVPAHAVQGDALHAAEWKENLIRERERAKQCMNAKHYKGSIAVLKKRESMLRGLFA